MGLTMFDPPTPIDPSYQPSASIVRIPASSPIEDILAIIERDGGVILTDFATPEDLAAIDRDVEAHRTQTRSTDKGALKLIPKETLAVPGLVGKSPTIARICCESPVLEQLRTSILEEKFSVIREDIVEDHTIDPLLSISITFYIGPGAPRQRLHRDDNVHGIRHGGVFDLKRASQFGCLIAGSKTTRQNGATMFIPGSHRWDDTRAPRPDEVCFAEMDPGSALIFLASCYHGGGDNSTHDEVRRVHGLFFARGNLRTEENQFLAVPRSVALGMSEKMLSLLGYKKPTSILGVVDNDDPAVDLRGVLDRANA
ncbi:hypothetical protein G647_04079 [Cladophialophora carrionii CBS 160.54]|uniref:Phytanoyl-CoA dioxygenase n=1 Tax=Cladophialophora carrionii CBS 160.54 TaxID=1279043 RepID=V9DCY0_9EURO|nr:uncharacterized protein G647_04079 [Cladophialophora carrionii CBS 160.54]ETI24710.1 hypothetical protein G647_04079 [Cladophialophora carrionii CBS 160.54]